MQVKSVDNSRSGINFKSNNNMAEATAFVNMKDAQLKEIAYVMTYDKNSRKNDRKSLLSMFYAIPIVDTLASGILVKRGQKGYLQAERLRNYSLVTRVKSAGKTAGSWAMVLAAVGVYSQLKKAVTSNSDGAKKFEQKHPMLSFFLDIGLILGGIRLGEKACAKIKNKINKEPDLLKFINKKDVQLKKYLNNSKFNNKIRPSLVEGMNKLSKEFPKTVKASRFALANSMWILFGLGVLKMVHDDNKQVRKMQHTYHDLKDVQFATAKHLVNVYGVQKDMAAKKPKPKPKQEPVIIVETARITRAHHPEPDEDDDKVI